MREVDALIGQYTHEHHRPRADKALETLRKIASMVKPIMRQRGWHVGKLSEFYPAQQNLLGLNYNYGQRICIRLRYPRDETLFLPFEEVVDTMLHELAHNVFGPHDEKFHKLWNELRDDYEALIRKGYTGEGFLSKGQKLGGSGAKPIQEARRLARAAAEKRRGQNSGGPKRVGGSAPSDLVDIRKTIADAAQRRRDILKGCGNTEGDTAWKDQILKETQQNEIQTTAEIDDADMRAIEQAFMEMIREDEERQSVLTWSPALQDDPRYTHGATIANPRPGSMPPPPVPSASKPEPTPAFSNDTPGGNQPIIQSSVPIQDVQAEHKWSCAICTYDNPETYLCCEVCGIERPSKPINLEDTQTRTQMRQSNRTPQQPPGDHKVLRSRSSTANIARFTEAEQMKAHSRPIGWTCHTCGNFMESQWWTCSQCGAMKLNS